MSNPHPWSSLSQLCLYKILPPPPHLLPGFVVLGWLGFFPWSLWVFWSWLLFLTLTVSKLSVCLRKNSCLLIAEAIWKQEGRAKARGLNDASLQYVTSWSHPWKDRGWSSVWFCSSFSHEVSARLLTSPGSPCRVEKSFLSWQLACCCEKF